MAGSRRYDGPCGVLPASLTVDLEEAFEIGDAVVEELKLVALDKDDIEVVSAHVQDAMVKVADILWQPREHRFVMALNRFDWMTAVDAKTETKADYRRCRTALRFERVNACKCRNLDQGDKAARLNLLAVEFAESDSP